MNAGRSRLQRREQQGMEKGETVEERKGSIGRYRGVGGNDGGRGRNQTSRHRVERVDGGVARISMGVRLCTDLQSTHGE